MRLTNYANACCLMEAQGFRILTDPWLVDGVFEGGWHHYPPLTVRPEDLRDVDALFVSHVHPDHCDPQTLKVFRRDMPIVVLDHAPNFLHRVLREMGFTNLVAIADGTTAPLGPFDVTLYAPFTPHLFHESAIGNLIDCAAIFEHGGFSVFNFNDNTPDVASALRLRERHGRPTVAQIAYNAAGPFPSCFDNMDMAQKLAASERTLQRNFAHAAALGAALEPRWHMPFAGSFAVGGSQWRKNACRGAVSLDEAGRRLTRLNPDIPVLLLSEGQSLDLADGVRSAPYEPIDPEAERAYVTGPLAARSYPHESDPAPDRAALFADCGAARDRLWARQARFDFFPDLTVMIAIGESFFTFNLMRAGGGATLGPAGDGPRIEVRMDERLLRRILTGEAHWNNVEGGYHIDFVREPDVYVRDFHTIMSFFTA
ncbi:MAG TPA: MBL fold metallo-hydrolase [Caulobacteraceae bacterium]|nr:MBL fold metallo-hydrolase [Caulobacteraceae bacterium]